MRCVRVRSVVRVRRQHALLCGAARSKHTTTLRLRLRHALAGRNCHAPAHPPSSPPACAAAALLLQSATGPCLVTSWGCPRACRQLRRWAWGLTQGGWCESGCAAVSGCGVLLYHSQLPIRRGEHRWRKAAPKTCNAAAPPLTAGCCWRPQVVWELLLEAILAHPGLLAHPHARLLLVCGLHGQQGGASDPAARQQQRTRSAAGRATAAARSNAPRMAAGVLVAHVRDPART